MMKRRLTVHVIVCLCVLLAIPSAFAGETKQSGTSRQAEFVVYLKQVRSGVDLEDEE